VTWTSPGRLTGWPATCGRCSPRRPGPARVVLRRRLAWPRRGFRHLLQVGRPRPARAAVVRLAPARGAGRDRHRPGPRTARSRFGRLPGRAAAPGEAPRGRRTRRAAGGAAGADAARPAPDRPAGSPGALLAPRQGQARRSRAGRHGRGPRASRADRPYTFGDRFDLHIERTLRNAISRRLSASTTSPLDAPALGRAPGAGGDADRSPGAGPARAGVRLPVRLQPEDFEIEQTSSSRAVPRSVARPLALDADEGQLPRGEKGRHGDAFTDLDSIPARLPRHCGFLRDRPRDPGVRSARGVLDFVYGTNMQHALLLGRRLLAAMPARARSS